MITAAFLDSLASWSWLEVTASGPVAFVLLAHPGGTGEAPQLVALADALGLTPPGRRLADLGERIVVTPAAAARPAHAVVAVEGCGDGLAWEVGPRWARFAGGGGPVALLVGFGPLRRLAVREEVDAYLGVHALAGTLRIGVGRARRAATPVRGSSRP